MNPALMRLRRSIDGWDDDTLGKLYDHRVMSRLVKYLAPYKPRAILALVAMVVFAVTSYVQPLLIGLALRRFIAKGDLTGLNAIAIVFVVVALVSWGAQYVQLANTGYIGHRILYKLRTQMFDHLQKLSLRFHDNNEVGRVMSRMTSDVTVLQELLTSGLLTVFGGHDSLAAEGPPGLYPGPAGHRHGQRQPPGERLRRARDPEPLTGGRERPALRQC